MDVKSVSFQMFLILFFFITLGSESQISVFEQCQSNNQMPVELFFLGGGEHVQKPKLGEKKNFKDTSLGLISRVFH